MLRIRHRPHPPIPGLDRSAIACRVPGRRRRLAACSEPESTGLDRIGIPLRNGFTRRPVTAHPVRSAPNGDDTIQQPGSGPFHSAERRDETWAMHRSHLRVFLPRALNPPGAGPAAGCLAGRRAQRRGPDAQGHNADRLGTLSSPSQDRPRAMGEDRGRSARARETGSGDRGGAGP